MAEDTNDTGSSGGTNEIPAEVVAEAKSLGWVPKESFKGKETEWVNADEFVRRGHEVLPIVKENLRRTKEELNALRKEVGDFKATAEEFRKFTENAAEVKWKEREAELKAQYAKAVTDGDGEAAAELVADIQAHGSTPPKAVQPDTKAAPSLDPAFVKWREENPWYEQKGLQSVAITIGMRLHAEDGLNGPPLYEAVAKEMAELFPEKVQRKGDNAEGSRGGIFDEGGSRRGPKPNGKAKTYENLPADAKAACDKFIAKGFVKNREQYVKNYAWD